MMSAPRTASRTERTGSTGMFHRADSRRAKRAARPGFWLATRTLRMGRTASMASRCVRAWTPEPMIARSPASSRARSRVATPLTAAVRIAVIEVASMMARRLPVSASKSRTAPW